MHIVCYYLFRLRCVTYMTAGAVVSGLPDEVLAAFCPVLFLHHKDAYLPVSVEWFIERAQLIYYPRGVTGTAELSELERVPGGVVRLIPAGSVTQEKLLEVQAKTEQPGNLSLTVAPEHYGGCGTERLNEVPIYVHEKLVVDEYGTPEAYELNYATFYSFNGHYDLPAGLPLLRAGHHVGDWEHLTVRLDADSLELQGVWYNAHRNIEGEWCPAALVPRTPCGRILGHVAINGHGIYPRCGTVARLFLLANDRTSRRGPVWSPGRLVRLCGLTHGSSCPVVLSRGCSLPHVPGREGGGSSRLGVPRPPPPPPAPGSTCSGPSCPVPAATAAPVPADTAALLPADAAARAPDTVRHPVSATATATAAAYPLPQVAHDTSPWQRYQGRWGSILTPTQQGWFQRPEPPVSRGLLRRLCLPWAPGVERLPCKGKGMGKGKAGQQQQQGAAVVARATVAAVAVARPSAEGHGAEASGVAGATATAVARTATEGTTAAAEAVGLPLLGQLETSRS